MLQEIELRYFKCFELLKLPLAPLTILSGANASGKSSVLQALVLLHQTMLEHEWSSRLLLNGNSLSAGTVLDVVDKVHGRRHFQIGVMGEDCRVCWEFQGDREEMSAQTTSVMVDGTPRETGPLHYLMPPTASPAVLAMAEKIRRLSYLTAERLGPREVYPLQDRQAAGAVGRTGEHAAGLLHWRRDESVLPGLTIEGSPSKLLRQVEARMNEFFPGCGLDLQRIPNANAVTLGIRTGPETDFHRPIHVGFGLTQVFPIVVAALSAREGGLLLVENPEVHLHPAGQGLMGQFLADVASAGVQVVVETHSDHILSGVRRSVRAQRLAAAHTGIHYFRARSEGATQVVSPILDPQGNIDHWPEGFFDQFDKDMNHFAGWDN